MKTFLDIVLERFIFGLSSKQKEVRKNGIPILVISSKDENNKIIPQIGVFNDDSIMKTHENTKNVSKGEYILNETYILLKPITYTKDYIEDNNLITEDIDAFASKELINEGLGKYVKKFFKWLIAKKDNVTVSDLTNSSKKIQKNAFVVFANVESNSNKTIQLYGVYPSESDAETTTSSLKNIDSSTNYQYKEIMIQNKPFSFE